MPMRMLLTLVAVGAVVASPITWAAAANPIDHDEVARLSGSVDADQATFLPLLKVVRGCQPYAAVQDDGSYSGGLKNSGGESSGCQNNGSGQTIVRTQCGEGVCAHMYALYFPKDQGTVLDIAVPVVGHRHEWENVVVWVKDGAVAAVSFSQHSGYAVKRPGDVVLKGTNVSVQYDADGGTHIFRPGSGDGNLMPAPVSFESVTTAARNTLNDRETFGEIDFPERDDNFAAKLDAARPSWL